MTGRIGICLLVGTLFFAGCATTKKTVSRPPQAKTTGIVEDFDPMSLTDDHFKIPPKTETVSTTSPADTLAAASKNPAAPSVQKRVRTVKVPGYRIQIAAVSNQQDAMNIQREAMLKFEDVNVYLVFEPPFYKVRIGDFERRFDAEEYQRKAIAAGYRDAWIVRTTIVKKVQQE